MDPLSFAMAVKSFSLRHSELPRLVDRQVTTVNFVAMLSIVSFWYQVLVVITQNLNHVVILTWSLSFKFLLARNINQVSLPINMTVLTTWPACSWRWYSFLTWSFAFFVMLRVCFVAKLWRWAWQPTADFLLVALTSEQSFWRSGKRTKKLVKIRKSKKCEFECFVLSKCFSPAKIQKKLKTIAHKTCKTVEWGTELRKKFVHD